MKFSTAFRLLMVLGLGILVAISEDYIRRRGWKLWFFELGGTLCLLFLAYFAGMISMTSFNSKTD